MQFLLINTIQRGRAVLGRLMRTILMSVKVRVFQYHGLFFYELHGFKLPVIYSFRYCSITPSIYFQSLWDEKFLFLDLLSKVYPIRFNKTHYFFWRPQDASVSYPVSYALHRCDGSKLLLFTFEYWILIRCVVWMQMLKMILFIIIIIIYYLDLLPTGL